MRNSKKTNKLLLTGLTLAVMIPLAVFASQKASADSDPSPADLPVNEKSHKVHTALQAVLENHQKTWAKAKLEKATDEENALAYEKTPEDYGGSYVDGNQVVVLKKTLAESATDKALSAEVKGQVKVKKASYSLNELNDLMSHMNRYFRDHNNDITDMFTSFWLDEKNNQIVVELIDLNEGNIARFKDNISDSEAITFVQSSGAPKCE